MKVAIDKDERRRLGNAQRRTMRVRRAFRAGTTVAVSCPASRHLHIMADALASGQTYHMFAEDPAACAETMYAVLESLWKARALSGEGQP